MGEPRPNFRDVVDAMAANSRPMTREERRELDASAWADLEPITVTDDPLPPVTRVPRELWAWRAFMAAIVAFGLLMAWVTRAEWVPCAVFVLLASAIVAGAIRLDREARAARPTGGTS